MCVRGWMKNMKNKYSIISCSVLAALVCIAPDAAYSALRVGNHSRSYADAYGQVNALRAQADAATQPVEQTVPLATTASADADTGLPVRVADANLANQIASGATDTPVGYNQLDACAMIYPNGEFAWDTPTLGRGAGGAGTCVAVVEMRGYQMGENGQDVVLARANLAAGDSVKCNISEFPEYSYTTAAGNIVFPADTAPTMDDVVDVMNQEQKKNAGIKIAAGALIGALGGNMAGENDVGNTSLLGTDKGKLQGTAIGALSGAALMAGNAYAGKVGGDIILSTGVNAAAGGVIGNMAGTGESVLRIEDCDIDGRSTRCLWGMVVTNTPLRVDEHAFFNISDGGTTYVCDVNDNNCKLTELVAIELDAYPGMNIDEVSELQFENIELNSNLQYHLQENSDGTRQMVLGPGTGNAAIYAKISSAGRIDRQIPAMVEIKNERNYGVSMTRDDWRSWRNVYGVNTTVYQRAARGDVGPVLDSESYSFDNFYPMYQDASDGRLIDLGNKARLRSTLIGAGAGGAMGAFTAYQGAQNDIENRWVTAVREYNDSLQKVYCITGDRFLGYYNDDIYIPALNQQ